ncbi:AAA family ATPase [Shimazuella sp. AN120528]|uniref:AAA family ATPase n=1 Tax=Shimazuella soli TaxID=1892854 RepID=UPI001F0E61A1|nr:AAA family ATPase [Shimazuella soli]MCH5586393.1 AAA family ATPase [Shimazuella soli]
MSRKVLLEETKRRIQIVFDRDVESTPADWEKEHQSLTKCLHSLRHLIGLTEIKSFVEEIYAWLEIGKRRKNAGLTQEQQVLHMVFTGNPGTGKTTVARIIGELFQEMGVLTRGHVIEVERADLVGEYIGHTAQKTREHVKQALGGILFIDEAYALSRGGEKDFGKEAIDTLVKSMEDYKNEFVLILAGYSQEMEAFIRSNPGLPSRFPIHLKFPDFSITELLEIADLMVKQREYVFSATAKEKIRQLLQREAERKNHTFGNARFIRNLVEQAIRLHAVRLLKKKEADRHSLMTILPEDILFESIGRKNYSSW